MIKEYDSNAKIIMCSAIGQPIIVIESLKSGAKGFVIKPFTKEKVIEVIKKVLGNF